VSLGVRMRLQRALMRARMQMKELETQIARNFRGLANTAFHPTPVHLLTLTTTLAQACGSMRLVIKKPSFSINSVRPCTRRMHCAPHVQRRVHASHAFRASSAHALHWYAQALGCAALAGVSPRLCCRLC
jgi:hypothetical protein